MTTTSTDIHCSHREPYELGMESLLLGNTQYENFSTLKLTISEYEYDNRHTATFYLPASMSERLARAVKAFNAELARDALSLAAIAKAEDQAK